MKNYSLQAYKGMATRHTCPNCGNKRSFAYYVDEENVPLHPSVGRCNHESSIGNLIGKHLLLMFLMQPALNDPVDIKVRISSDRRCEVAVIL